MNFRATILFSVCLALMANPLFAQNMNLPSVENGSAQSSVELAPPTVRTIPPDAESSALTWTILTTAVLSLNALLSYIIVTDMSGEGGRNFFHPVDVYSKLFAQKKFTFPIYSIFSNLAAFVSAGILTSQMTEIF